ncbi:hypothetical protein GCK72_011430 [Caenorhabditis remanei]|uniref:Calpain catalytic domain-containing protein n=1 Tax=Caenorhabditis remanei TaxID=31234 RepID=A0A6A5H8P3_CAERE|nr:hypothetical protein GCK72_011430 [Caenorhabditis remanei]KAF1763164.1 hypothetical protein GCK72_011430 [Caenorhabditis remanei]
MSFSVIFHPSPDDKFGEIDNEFQEHAHRLRKSRKLFVDPEFPHNKDSIGTNMEESEDLTPVAWWAPHQLINNYATSLLKTTAAMHSYIDNNKAMRAKDPAWKPDSNLFEKALHNCNKIRSTKWSVYDNPWPFHVGEGYLDDAWLLAPLMCIARRKEILEHVLPDRDYIKDCGMVQVRLFINGKWEVLKLDYFIPKSYGVRTIYANIIQCQLWVALIEKAFAKVKGNYGNLDEGSCEEAFTYLTGCPCRSQKSIKKWMK